MKGIAECRDAADPQREDTTQFQLPFASILSLKMKSIEGRLKELMGPEGSWETSFAESCLYSKKQEEIINKKFFSNCCPGHL